jgi:hypothetical protein
MFSANAKKYLRAGSGEVLVFQASAFTWPFHAARRPLGFTVISGM